jgi:cytochrome b involved in lipid metabolism
MVVGNGGKSSLTFLNAMRSNKTLQPTDRPVVVSELQLHNKPYDAWIAIEKNVYDVTFYLEYHPGGRDEILAYAGTDATAAFMKIHRWVSHEGILEKVKVGRLQNPSVIQSTITWVKEKLAK